MIRIKKNKSPFRFIKQETRVAQGRKLAFSPAVVKPRNLLGKSAGQPLPQSWADVCDVGPTLIRRWDFSGHVFFYDAVYQHVTSRDRAAFASGADAGLPKGWTQTLWVPLGVDPGSPALTSWTPLAGIAGELRLPDSWRSPYRHLSIKGWVSAILQSFRYDHLIPIRSICHISQLCFRSEICVWA